MLDEQSEPSTVHGRRKRDAELMQCRSSHWVEGPGDIWLKPHSPLALVDLLAQVDARLSLVASDESDNLESDSRSRLTSTPDSDPDSGSIPGPTSGAGPRLHANLLTRHASAELKQRCKQLLIDNALVKQRQARRLFLVAGFVRESHPALAAAAAQWPVLFYPVVLVREPCNEPTLDTANPGRYLLTLDGRVPEINPHLRRHLKTHHATELPCLARSQDVGDFLAELGSLLSPCSTLELMFEMALGSCVPPLLDAPAGNLDALMPDRPTHFDAELARHIAGQASLPELDAVVSMLRDYAHRQEHETHPTSPAPAGAVTSNLRLHAEQLVERGLGTLDCQSLRRLPERLERWAGQVEQALTGQVVGQQPDGQALGARHLIRLGGVIELIDKAPLAIERYAFANLCYANSVGLLRRARHQARLIEEEFNALRAVFVLERIPPRKLLLSLIDELAHVVHAGPDVVGPAYFNARRQFMEFSVEKPTRLTDDHRRAIAQLEKLLRFRELFVNNTEYRLAFGPGYRGLRTDWAELENMLDYARELAEVLESETLAAGILSQWGEFRDAYINEMPTLQQAAEASRRLLTAEGVHHQHAPAAELAARARDTAHCLRQWQQQFGPLPEHDELTPAVVLGQFQPRTAGGDATAQDMQAWFGTHEHSSEALIDTLDWLQKASNTATELQLDVRAIVDCLRIA